MPAPIDVSAVAGDPSWLAHRYDPVRDVVQFRHLTRAGHRAATFLTDDDLGTIDPVVIARTSVVAAARSTRAPLHFIVHSAFCGSTLLARALDVEGVATTLKEPVILNDLVGWRHRGARNDQLVPVLADALTLLARPFAPGEAVIVKPSNIANVFAPLILAMRSDARALLLHTPLPLYLASIAKKGMWGRLWVRDLLVKQLKDGLIDLGFAPEDHLEQTDLQVAAVGWLAQQALFARLVDLYPDRVRTLDSETLVAEPTRVVAALGRLYGLTLDATAIATGPIFSRHSKFGGAFGRDERAAEQRTAGAAHEDEIAKVTVWANAVAERVGVALALKAPLLA